MRVLSPVSIKAADDHGAALVIEPGLNLIAHMEPAERRLFLPLRPFCADSSQFLFGWVSVVSKDVLGEPCVTQHAWQ